MSARSVRKGTWRTLFVLLLAVTLTGCLQSLESAVYEPVPPPPTPLNQLGAPVTNASALDRNVRANITVESIPMPDGAALFATVVRPGATEEVPFEDTPVLLVISPYNGVVASGVLTGEFSSMVRFFTTGLFLARGYAVVAVDSRGTSGSEGCPEFGGPLEQADAVALVEHYARAPWSNGRVGIIGFDYEGWAGLMAAVNGAEGLAAVAAVAPMSNAYDLLGAGGAKYAGAHDEVMKHMVERGDGAPRPPVDALADPETSQQAAMGYAATLQFVAPMMVSDTTAGGVSSQSCKPETVAAALDLSGLETPWMKARDLRVRAGEATTPIFLVHAFDDEVVRVAHTTTFYEAYGGPKRAFLWHAGHVQPLPDATGLGQSAFFLSLIQWFDYHLAGHQNGIETTYEQVEVQDSLGRWRSERVWPPADVASRSFSFGPDGAMALNSTAAGTLSWRDDAFERGGKLGTRTSRFAYGATETALTFRSDILTEDLHVAGRPLVRAFVESDRPNSLVVARLYEVLPDGSWVLLNEGVRSLALRGALDSPQPVRPGEVVEVPVEMQPTELVFRAGSAIGITLTSSDADYVITTGTSATNTLHLGGDSALELPVIVRTNFTSQTWGQAQPAWLGPIAWEAVR